MGTRSTTTITSNGTPILSFYRQYDGYPSGHGHALATILKSTKITNGYGGDQHAPEWANGAGCLAAQLLAKLKDESGIGGIYCQSIDAALQEYNYLIAFRNDKDGKDKLDRIVVSDSTGHNIFDGKLAAFLKFCGED